MEEIKEMILQSSIHSEKNFSSLWDGSVKDEKGEIHEELRQKIEELQRKKDALLREIELLDDLKTKRVNALSNKKAEFDETSATLCELQERIKTEESNISECQRLIAKAKSGFSREDIELFEDTKERVKLLRRITGVMFEIKDGKVSHGYVVNPASGKLRYLLNEFSTDIIWEKVRETMFTPLEKTFADGDVNEM